MSAIFNRPAPASLHAIMALVAGSAIVCARKPQPGFFFSDWAKQRRSADVDALVLAWIASHVPASAHRGRLN